MQGLLRLILALVVVRYHFFTTPNSMSGAMAVFGFYVVSGYLVTRVTNTFYRGRTGAFFLNRALRIYPAYFVVLAFSVAVVSFLPEPPNHAPMRLPQGWGWIPQLTLFGLWSNPIRLVSTAWTLNVELVFYVLIALVLGTRRHATVWWLASLAANSVLALRGSFPEMYASSLGPSLAFASGAMLYHYPFRLEVGKYWALAAILSTGLLLEIGDVIGRGAFLYTAIPATAVALVLCLEIPSGRLDRFLGDLSYPIYLWHRPIQVLFVETIGNNRPAMLVATLVASAALVVLVERPFQNLRTKIRGAAS